MSVSTIIAIFRFLIWLVAMVMEAYNDLTPEDKEKVKQVHEEWIKKCRELEVPMGGDGEGP